jgi:hypothetical protein
MNEYGSFFCFLIKIKNKQKKQKKNKKKQKKPTKKQKECDFFIACRFFLGIVSH